MSKVTTLGSASAGKDASAGWRALGPIRTISRTESGARTVWRTIPAICRGKEQQPQNFKIPQLTFAADHPGEDLSRFRFAF